MSQEEPQDERPIRVNREVPLPWLLTIAAVAIGQGATVYFAQQRQGELIAAQSVAIKELSDKFGTLSAQVGGKDLKDVQHDLQIGDLQRRVGDLEEHGRGKRR